MQSPFPFDSLLVFGFLSAMLLFGVFIRAKVPVVQKYLFPACLIGGCTGLALVSVGLVEITATQFEAFAYHFFNVSFISVGLTKDEGAMISAETKKKFFKGTIWMALTQGITFPIQAIVGGAFVIIFGFFGLDLFKTFGFLCPLGFNEGPGQALSFGKAWESMGFEHGATIGLSFAAIGFFFAFMIGVPLANWGLRKGLAMFGDKNLPTDFIKGIVPDGNKCEPAGELKLHSGNIDSLAFQSAIIGLVYGIAYFIVSFLTTIVDPDIGKMLWGFLFFFGLFVAILVKFIMDKIGIGYLVDSGIQRRITGWSVDFLIVATIPAIQMLVVWTFILPITIISLVNGLLTFLIVFYFGRRMFSENLERMLAIFGTVTGTISCGLLLLRIVDPEFKTSVAVELALMNIFVFPILFICTLIVNAPLWWDWSLPATLAAFVGIMMISISLIRLLKLAEEPKF